MKFECLHSISPINYNNLFSRGANKNNSIVFRNIFNNENKNKNNNSIFFISQNNLKDNNTTFNFYKTDLVPFPKFPKIHKGPKFNKKKLLLPKAKKKNTFISIKYLKLIKDINNQSILKNYYFLKHQNKIKNNEESIKIIKIFLENDFESIKNGINDLINIKHKIEKDNNSTNDIKRFYNIKNINNNFNHNIFLKDILNNINRKIEIYNKENNELDVILVKNLLIKELNKLEKNLKQIKKDIKIMVKENMIKSAYNNSPSKAFSLSSSSSSSNEENAGFFNQKYFHIFLKNYNKGVSQAKNFKNEYYIKSSSFNITQRNNCNLSLNQANKTSNNQNYNNHPSIYIYNYKSNYFNRDNSLNKASDLINEISNKIEKKYRIKITNVRQNIYLPNKNISNSVLNTPKKTLLDKMINTKIKDDNIYKYFINKNNDPLLMINPINDINQINTNIIGNASLQNMMIKI